MRQPGICFLIFLANTALVLAQETPPPEAAPSTSGLTVIQHTFAPDTPPNPTLYDQLPADEKSLVDDLEEWAVAVHSPDVHNAYAAYAAQVGQQAQLDRAAIVSGLDGIAEAGVQ